MKTLKNRIAFLTTLNVLSAFIIYSVLYFSIEAVRTFDNSMIIIFAIVLVINFLNYGILNFLVIENIKRIKDNIEKINSKSENDIIKSDGETNGKVKEFVQINELLKAVREERNQDLNRIEMQTIYLNKIKNKANLILQENKKTAIHLKQNLVSIKDETDKQLTNILNTENSVTEMVTGIRSINDIVSKLAENATAAIENARIGNQKLEKVVENMNEIQQNAEDSVVTIDDLGEKIKEIQIIVDVINSISSRTNLLALNATIEAEKAITEEGNNGDGFIVVSDEIKKLALKSSTSTIEIEKIAKLIIDNKDKAIDQIDKNRKEVRKGITVVTEASKSFNSILSSTHRIGNQLFEVTTSSEQLDRSTEEIMNKISNNTTLSKDFKRKIETVENSLEMIITSVESINELLNDIEELNNKREKAMDVINND